MTTTTSSEGAESLEELRELLRRHGYNTDIKVSADIIEEAESLTESRLSSHRWDFSYRDQNPRDSVHVVKKGEETLAHLERFNPRHYLFLHFLIDVPL